MRTIGIILKKELKRFFTDYRMLMGIILPGLLIFVIYTIMGNIMQDSFAPDNNYIVYIENEPEAFKLPASMEAGDSKISFIVNERDLTKEEILNGIREKEIHAYIVYEEGFMDKVNAYDPASGNPAPNIELYFNSSDETSSAFYQFYVGYLDTIEAQMTNKFDINRGDGSFDLATKEDVSKLALSMMLPLLLMIFLFSGCMAFCSESIAGEKERGTFATMLITPAKRYQIALGKVLALAIASLSSSVVSFIGLIASLPTLMGGDITLSMYGVGTFVLFLLVIMVTVLLYTTILTMTSAYAKSVKEASTLASPIMIVVMLISLTGMMQRDFTPATAMYLIPIYNSLQCFSGLLRMDISMLNLGVTILSNIVFIGLGVFALAKMFNSERIMFNK